MTPADHHAHHKHVIIAILSTCTAYAFFNIGDAAVKMLAHKFHFSQIMAMNGALIIFFMCCYGWLKEGRKAFKAHQPKLIVLRALFAATVAALNVVALAHIKLATFYTLVFTSPFWVALLSALFLGEQLERRRMLVILAGFAIILFIFRPGGGLFSVWSLLVLLSAFFYACSMTIMRRLGPQASRTVVISVGSLMSIIFALPFLTSHYITPTPYEWGVFLLLGVTGAIGMMCISYAFQNAPSAALIAPYHYTQIVWGVLLGYFLFHEIPDFRTLLGAAGIICAGLYLVYGETRRPVLRVSGV